MADELVDEIKLPYSTAECDLGPEISQRPGRVTVRYDAEGDDKLVWVEIRFAGALALRVTPDPAVTEPMLTAYSKVCTVRSSEWENDLRAAAVHGDGELPEGLRHFVVYFDHFGCVEVMARQVEIAEP